jgi:hypothetical protein
VAGHGRLELLFDLKGRGEQPPEGIEARDDDWYVPIITGIAFKDADEAAAYLFANNEIGRRAGYDKGRQLEMLSALKNKLGGTGFTAGRLAAALRERNKPKSGNPQDLLDSLVMRPGFNKKRTLRFLSIRRWDAGKKHEQSQEFRKRKDNADHELARLIGVEVGTVLKDLLGNTEGMAVTSAPPGRSAERGHFATVIAQTIAETIGGRFVQLFEPIHKATKGVVTEVDEKRNIVRTAEPLPPFVILFDDVSTTGTTLEACKDALIGATILPVAWVYSESKPLRRSLSQSPSQ